MRKGLLTWVFWAKIPLGGWKGYVIDEWGSYAFSCVTPITVWVVTKNESNCLLKCLWNEKLSYWKIGEFERPLKVKNSIFLFVISHLVPEIFKIFVLCKLGTDDVIRCVYMKVKTQIREYLYEWCKTIGIWQARCTLRNAPHDAYFDVAMATVLLPVSFCCKSNAACLTV